MKHTVPEISLTGVRACFSISVLNTGLNTSLSIADTAGEMTSLSITVTTEPTPSVKAEVNHLLKHEKKDIEQ